MRVAVVAEYYPRAHDPALGIWAHRQAVAARDAGADVRVVVLHRPIAPVSRAASPGAWRDVLAQPRHAVIDGIDVSYVRYVSPPRGRSYQDWGRWAARPLGRELRRLRQRFPFDLVHAHYAVPAADAVLRAGTGGAPLVISEHGGDVFHTVRLPGGHERVRNAFSSARLVLANSDGVERMVRALGARATRVVGLGTDVPATHARTPEQPTLVTVAHLVARKRHEDVLRAMWILRERHPTLRYLVVGDGPRREPLQRLATELGIAGRVEFTGGLAHPEAVARGREGSIFVMPSTDEAFGVAYVEAMAAGLPAIGSRGEPGPEHIAARGEGMRLVAPGEPEGLAHEIDGLLQPGWGARLGAQAARTVAAHFTWQACGRATVDAYEEALRAP